MRTLKITVSGVLAMATLSALSFGANSLAQAATPSALTTCQTTVKSQVHNANKLTIATDNPVYEPWFIDNKPSSGKGYESAVAYAIGAALGFKASNVNWISEPFDSSYAPGAKSFDFDINEISYTADRAQVVTFSKSYYSVQQSIVTLKTSGLVKNHSASELRNYVYGDQVGTTGLAYITNHIKPTKAVRVFNTLDLAVAALQAKQIDAVVVDTPTGNYMANYQIVDSKEKSLATQVGQFASVGEYYGLLFQKNNPLAACVNVALAGLTANGTLAKLSKQYLGMFNNVPKLTPFKP